MPTPNFNIPYLSENQSQKHVTVNEAFDIIDTELATPSGSTLDEIEIINIDNEYNDGGYVEYDLSQLPDFTSKFGTLPADLKIYKNLRGKWRSNVSTAAFMAAAWATYTVVWVMPSASGASNSNDGSKDYFVGAGVGPKASMSGLITSSTNMIIILEAGYEFTFSEGWGNVDLGGHKIIVSSEAGTPVYLTSRITRNNITWAADTTPGVWTTTDAIIIGNSPGGAIVPGITGEFNRTKLHWTAADLTACRATVGTTVLSGGVYYINTGDAVNPPSAQTKVYFNGARQFHRNPDYNLICRDIVFEGGSVPFSSINGHLISGITNASPPVVTCSVTHGLSDGRRVEIQGTGTALDGATLYADVLTTSTFALYTDSGLTTPAAAAGVVSALGIWSTYAEIFQVFERCEFRHAFGSGQNAAELSGKGVTYMKNCKVQDTRSDGLDGRADRLIIADSCIGRYTGSDNGLLIDQAFTMHAGAKLISCNCEFSDTRGPNVQHVMENGRSSYHASLGDYYHNNRGTAPSGASRSMVVAGVGSTDDSRIWLIDPKFTDRYGGGQVHASGLSVFKIRADGSTAKVYYNVTVPSSERTFSNGGTEQFIFGV